MSEELDPGPVEESPQTDSEQLRPVVTRREFIAGAGAGVAVGAVVAGGIAIATRPNAQTQVVTQPGGPAVSVPAAPAAGQPAAQPTAQAQAQAPGQAQPQAPAPQQLPLSQRRVELNLDGVVHPVVVDVRESLWETMIYKLGKSSSNLGCDRAQCGACTVVIDGRAVNGCTVLASRLGRGQKILTVDGIRDGPGIAGLHPVQKAFWQMGGYQCGICTRGFIMSTYALLQVNKSPTHDEIAEALSGNICRCSEYPQIFDSVNAAAAEMRGEKAITIGVAAGGEGGSLEDPSLAE
ncbi:MAG TPA: 2Fe-2S iron-sulfur cluster-binding protein [Chloroflexota bacterium]|nr:2Fe-2S iron-sulfur cluster-binding protein [Chloroflexota bacterium]